MIRSYIILLLLIFSCGTRNSEKEKQKSQQKYSGHDTKMFAVEIRSMELNDKDFNLNTLGSPYPVVFRLFENNRLIWKEVLGSLRGRHAFKHNDATKIISFNKKNSYRIVIKDDGLITFPDTWGGGEWDVGVWPFDQLQGNKMYKGTSWIEVLCHPISEMDYRLNKQILDS
tara:strand:- start:22043 stop:22555 length:513 start_codon:yes stop_codon:yes gene_type:complete